MDDESEDHLLAQAASCFGVTPSQLSPLAGGNYAQVFEWDQAGRAYVLKISPVAQVDEIESTRSMLDWLAYLAAQGAPVVQPIPSLQSRHIECIKDAGERYLVSASAKINGLRAETLPLERWDDGLIQQLGHVLGRCHALAYNYQPAESIRSRPVWDQADNCFNPVDDLKAADPMVLEKRAQVLAQIEGLPRNGENWGLAHLDIHFANFIVDSATDAVVLIDFDDCGYGWFAMDLAMLLFDLLVLYPDAPRAELSKRFLDNLLAGYRTEKAITKAMLDQLPAFLKLLEIGIYAMLVGWYDPATCDDAWVNSFMHDRARRICDNVPYLE